MSAGGHTRALRLAAILLALGAAACGGDDASAAPTNDAGAPSGDATEADASPAFEAAVDGAADTVHEATTSPDVVDAAPKAGIFVAVGYGGRRVRSLDGVTWTDDAFQEAMGGDDQDLLRAVRFGGGQFVAVGWRVQTSGDGVTWVDHGVMGQWLGGLEWGNGEWVAVGGYGRRATSPDGISFTDVPDSLTAAYRQLALGGANGGVWLAMGDQGRLSTTTDGTHWTELASIALGGAAWGAGVWVGIVGADLRVSNDAGASWTVAKTASGTLDAVTFAAGQFVAVGSGLSLTSPDGMAWTEHTAAGVSGSIAYGNGVYVACGGWVPPHCYHAKDGVTWTEGTLPANDTNSITSVAFGAP